MNTTPEERRNDGSMPGHPHDLVGAWVLDAVAGDDRTEFEAHLPACPSCRAEAASLRDAVVGLAGDAAPVAPPSSLREAVMAAVDATPQVMPTALDPATHVDQVETAAAAPVVEAPVAPTPVAPPQQASGDDRTDPSRAPAARQTLASRLGLGLAAALVLVLGGVGIWAQGVRGELADQQTRNEAVAAVLADPESTVIHADSSVLVRAGDGRAVFTSADVAAPEGQVLQMWVIDADGPESAGLVETPTSSTLLDLPVPDGVVVGVTVEPEGGSPAPTSDPVVVFET